MGTAGGMGARVRGAAGGAVLIKILRIVMILAEILIILMILVILARILGILTVLAVILMILCKIITIDRILLRKRSIKADLRRFRGEIVRYGPGFGQIHKILEKFVENC